MVKEVVVFGDFSGRLDHSLSNLNTQLLFSNTFKNLKLIGLSSISLIL